MNPDLLVLLRSWPPEFATILEHLRSLCTVVDRREQHTTTLYPYHIDSAQANIESRLVGLMSSSAVFDHRTDLVYEACIFAA